MQETLTQSKYEVSDNGETINISTGKVVNIKKIDSISKSGEANLTLDNGMVVKASDLSFGSEAESVIIGNIGAIKIGNKPISTSSANALYQTALTVLKDNPNMTLSEATSLIRGLTESYIYGRYNLGTAKLTARNEDGTAVMFAGELSQAHRKYAYGLGTRDSVSSSKAEQKFIENNIDSLYNNDSSLNDAESHALLSYKSSESYKINEALRNGETLTDGNLEYIENLDNALSKLPVYQGIVYRNISFDDFGGQAEFDSFLREHDTGNIVSYKSYTSASTEKDGYEVDGDYVIEMVVESINARNVDGYGNNFESEVIFP